MFEFAIDQQKRHPPSRRYLASVLASCVAHLAAVQILIAFPALLGPGIAHWFRHPSGASADKVETIDWRTVTVLNSPAAMRSPSAATLQKYTYDWEKAAAQAGISPPIRVSWRGEIEESAAKTAEPLDPVAGKQEPVETAQAAAGAADLPPAAGNPGADQAVTTSEPGVAPPGGRVVYLPAPQTESEPRQIPRKVQEAPARPITAAAAPAPKPAADSPPPMTAPAPQQPAAQIFESRQQALQSEASGFFDTKGFPLGEYASAIIARVKGNWFIPSNLRNSRGRTTVVFFIGKDGKYTGAQIVRSSGITSLDLAALNAVLTSNPFPPLPPGFPGSQVGAKFVFAYNEQQ